MQKKSLLVALFCGALCLTGCIKNEESASVAQVRIAKANELNSIADLNKAKAAAEAVYAEAELTLAKAEAELKKANAALVLAQAETEKVRAELLKVRVKLAEVKVDEEKIELQRKEAELEVYLAQYEAQIAASEAAKQAWVNALNNLLAQAQVDAINNAKKVLDAEKNLEDYVLTLVGQKADSAKHYARLYFDAYDRVQKLEKEQLVLKAEKALVEAGALEIRDALHEQMAQVDEKIAEKEAIIEYLEANQTMTPEAAEAALAEAREELNVAYNAYQAAIQDRKDAQTKLAQEKNKTSDFWKDSKWTDVQNALLKAGVVFYPDEAYPVKVGDATVKVKTAVFNVATEEGVEAKPLFGDEVSTPSSFVRYPDIHVIADGRMRETDHVDITTTTIAPATLYYDNIQEALDTVLAQQQRFAKWNFDVVEWWNNMEMEWNKQKIADLTSKNLLQAKYVEARKADVEKYEQAYIDALAAQETYKTDKADAWKAFQEYMLLKTDVSRAFFTDQYVKDTIHQAAHKDSVETAEAYKTAKQTYDGLVEAGVEDLFEDAAKAEGTLDSLLKRRNTATTTDAYKFYKALEAAEARWNPKFATAVAADATPTFAGYVKPASGPSPKYQASHANIELTTEWFVDTNNNGSWDDGEIKGGSAQDSLYSANYNLALQSARVYEATLDSLRNKISTEDLKTIKQAYKAADEVLEGTATIDGVKKKASNASKAYQSAKSAYDGEIGNKIAAAEKAWTNVNIFNYVTFPTEARPSQDYWYDEEKYDKTKKEWKKTGDLAPGTAQVALFNAVKAIVDGKAATKIPVITVAIANPKTIGEKMANATLKDKQAEADYELATKKLIVAIEGGNPESEADIAKVDLEEVDLTKYVDAKANKLYQDYLDVEDESKVNAYRDTLWAYYLGFNPDQIDRLEKNPKDNQYTNSGVGGNTTKAAEFGWLRSSYNVDSEATYVNLQGEEEPIAWILYPWDKNQFTHSYAYRIEALTKENAEEIPARIEGSKKWWANYMKGVQDNIDAALAVVNTYKGYEASYTKWVEDRIAAEEAYNKARMAEFDAREEKVAAQANYDAKKLIAEEGMWVYDKDNAIKTELGDLDGVKHKDDFTFVPFTKAIELLKGDADAYYTVEQAFYAAGQTAWDNALKGRDNEIDLTDCENILKALNTDALQSQVNNIEELKFAKKLIQKTLEYGKLALEVFVEAYDEEIEELDEKIEVYSSIADMYKAIMNAYLGIVEDGETGPLDEEEEGEGEE